MTQRDILQHLLDNCTNEVYLRGLGWYKMEKTGYMVQLPKDYIRSEVLDMYFMDANTLYQEDISHHKICSAEKLFEIARGRDLDGLGNFFYANEDPQGAPHLSRIKIPVEAQDVSKCEAWALSVYPQNTDLLKQIGGYILFSPDNRFQKIFLVTGSGANGKGTFLRILTAILEGHVEGERLATAVDLDELTLHERVEILGKQLIYDADISGSNKSLRWLKVLSGGDRITARGLYKTQITFTPTCKILLLSNPIPSWESSPALTRRLVLLQFKQRFAVDPTKELSFLTPDMLRAWVWYFRQGYEDLKVIGFRLIEENNASEFLSQADDLGLFLQEYCTFDHAVSIPTETFYAAFERFWKTVLREKKTTPNSRIVGKRLREYGIEKLKNVTLSEQVIGLYKLNEQLEMDEQGRPRPPRSRWDLYRGITLKEYNNEN